MDAPHNADKAYREKARKVLHKNATKHIEKILVATSRKTAAVPPSTSHLSETIEIIRTRYAKHCWKSKGELVNDVF